MSPKTAKNLPTGMPCEHDFPLQEPAGVQLLYLVRYAILAPSTHNSQPWLFRVRHDVLELLADRSRAVPVCDPDHRELAISCGAALGHAALAAHHFGASTRAILCPDPAYPDLLARLWLTGQGTPSPEEEQRFAAICRRRTSRIAFAPDPLPSDILARIRPLAATYGIEAAIISDAETRYAISDLVAEADRRQIGNLAFRNELARWTRQHSDKASDGVSLSSFGSFDALSPAIAAMLRSFDLGTGVAARDRQLATGSPVMILLSSQDDTAVSWLLTGQALSDILLELTAADIRTAFLNQPIELPDCRFTLRGLVGTGGYPQLLLRVGRGPLTTASVRRSADQVIRL